MEKHSENGGARSENGPMVVDVVFTPAGKYNSHLCAEPAPGRGTPVVVETERGVSIAWVGQEPRRATAEDRKKLSPILRLATAEDLIQEDRNREREDAAFRVCLQLIADHGLVMKLVRVHYLLTGNKAVFYFTADGRVDFRALVRDLAAELRLRIEMRQIGVRDETKMIGGVGHCGRELCCATWLRSFVPVSIRMAKDQNLALNPQKVSGACGRLLCCLAYEHQNYVVMKRSLPKVNKRVMTTQGPGRVVSLEILQERFVVELDDGGRVMFTPDELVRGVEVPPPPSRARSATRVSRPGSESGSGSRASNGEPDVRESDGKNSKRGSDV